MALPATRSGGRWGRRSRGRRSSWLPARTLPPARRTPSAWPLLPLYCPAALTCQPLPAPPCTCSFQRGLKRKALALIKKLRKAKKEAASGEKPDAVGLAASNNC